MRAQGLPIPRQAPQAGIGVWAGCAPIDVEPVGPVTIRVELLKLHELVFVMTHATWRDPTGDEREFLNHSTALFPKASLTADPLAELGDRIMRQWLVEIASVVQADAEAQRKTAAEASAPPS